MGQTKRKKRRTRAKSSAFQHKGSVIAISCVIVMLAVMLSVGSIKSREKLESLKTQEAELQEQQDKEDVRAEEIDVLEEYVGTDEYVRDVAKEKLGLVDPNEILFKSEP